ncbi:hypothetical protein F5Y17DRAFT_472907 [Xylariaceae sp. FL0594]|nr:hypothetical protein F5Y17DRAFT_472907 [Xylariaceae sp. FL0594]
MEPGKPRIHDVPTEILLQILQLLAFDDLQTLLLAQRVDMRFHTAIQYVLSYDSRRLLNESRGTRNGYHYEIEDNYYRDADQGDEAGGGSRSGICLTVREEGVDWLLTKEDDQALPFLELPWAWSPAEPDTDEEMDISIKKNSHKDTKKSPAKERRESIRAAFLYKHASWRNLSPTFGSSLPFSLPEGSRSSNIIRRLDIVKVEAGQGLWDRQKPAGYSQAALPLPLPATPPTSSSPSSSLSSPPTTVTTVTQTPYGLTMEKLYDVFLCNEATFGGNTLEWGLRVGKALKNFDLVYRRGVLKFGTASTQADEQMVADVPDAAILYVTGKKGRTNDGGIGTPPRLRDARPVFCPWQGPLINPEETEW